MLGFLSDYELTALQAEQRSGIAVTSISWIEGRA
jgi:hypothetical protein